MPASRSSLQSRCDCAVVSVWSATCKIRKGGISLFRAMCRTAESKRLVNRLAPGARVCLWEGATVPRQLVRSGLDSGGGERFPVMWEQFGEPVHRMGGDARKHITEPGERLDPATFAGRDETQQDGRGLAAIVAAEKRPVAAANCNITVGSLGRSV